MTGRPADNDTGHFNGMTFSNYKRKRILCRALFFSLADASVAFSFTRAESFFFTFFTVVVVVVVDVVFVFVVPKRIFLFFRPKTPRVLREDAIFTLTVRFG